MKGGSDESGIVTGLGEVGREAIIDEIGHALGGCHLRASALNPRGTLEGFLHIHHTERIVFVVKIGMVSRKLFITHRFEKEWH